MKKLLFFMLFLSSIYFVISAMDAPDNKDEQSLNPRETQSLYEFFNLDSNFKNLPPEISQIIAHGYMKKNMPQGWGWWYNAVTFRHFLKVNSAVFNSRDDRILTASCDGTAKLWDLDGKLLATFRHYSWVNSAVFNSRDDRVLTASIDGTVRLWDLNGNELATFTHDATVTSAVFNSTGDRILTSSWDKTARLWDLNGNVLATFRHSDRVMSAVFNSTDDRVLTASHDKTAKLWTLYKYPTLGQVLLRLIIGKYLLVKKPEKKLLKSPEFLLNDISYRFKINIDDLQDAWNSLDSKIQNDLWNKIQIFVNKYKRSGYKCILS